MKEALIKALGVGFSMDISAFEIPPAVRRGSPEATFRFPHDPAVRWRLQNLGNARFAAAVAHELDLTPPTPPTPRRIDASLRAGT